jgi:hypothetical protein
MRLIGFRIGDHSSHSAGLGPQRFDPARQGLAAHPHRRAVSLGVVRRRRHVRSVDGERLAGHHRQLLCRLGQPDGYFVLHERINARGTRSLALCVAGPGVLVYPVAENP